MFLASDADNHVTAEDIVMAGKRTSGGPLPDGHPFKGVCIILGSNIPEAWKERFRKKQEQQKPQPDEPDDLEVQAFNDYEEALARSVEEKAKDRLPPFEAAAHKSYEEAMWDRYERETGRKRPADAPGSDDPG